jgi:hypothetical protein
MVTEFDRSHKKQFRIHARNLKTTSGFPYHILNPALAIQGIQM